MHIVKITINIAAINEIYNKMLIRITHLLVALLMYNKWQNVQWRNVPIILTIMDGNIFNLLVGPTETYYHIRIFQYMEQYQL